VATGFSALGDDHIHTPLSSLAGLLHCMDLVDHQYTSIVHPLDEVSRVPTSKRNDGWPGLQSEGESGLVQRKQQVVNGKGPSRQLPYPRQLSGEVINRPEVASQTPQSTGIRHCRHQLSRSESAHPRLNDGGLNT
jgi:hypothetical protein